MDKMNKRVKTARSTHYHQHIHNTLPELKSSRLVQIHLFERLRDCDLLDEDASGNAMGIARIEAEIVGGVGHVD